MDTYKIILEAHSGIAYVALATLLVASVNSLIGLSAKNEFNPKDRRIALFALIATHIQFVFGLILYFVSPNGLAKIKAVGMGGMSAFDRLLAVEHPLVNLIAIVLVTVGWSTHKRAENSNIKFKKIAIFYSIGLLLLLSRIPWQTWLS